MGIRWVVGATNKKDKEKSGHEAQDNANYQRHGGQSRGNDGGQGGNPGGVRNYYPPMETRPMPQYTGGGSGGNGAMNVGYYAGGSPATPCHTAARRWNPDRWASSRIPTKRNRAIAAGAPGALCAARATTRSWPIPGAGINVTKAWNPAGGKNATKTVCANSSAKSASLKKSLRMRTRGREVKRLKDRIEELEEKLDGMKREKRGGEKKRKSGGDREDGDGDDGEDDPARILEKILGGKEVTGKEFLMELPRLFQESVEVIKNPPSTWPPYLEKRDYAGIYAMESKELAQALEGFKSGQKKLKDVAKELKHTCAALIQLDCHRLHEDK